MRLTVGLPMAPKVAIEWLGGLVDDWKHGKGGRCAIGGFSAAEI